MAFADKMTPDQTERLEFRHFNEADKPVVFSLNKMPEVTVYVGGLKTDQEIELDFKKYLEYHERHPGYGYWYTSLKSTGDFVGIFLVKVLIETAETEIGYRLHPDYWGKGLATEGAKGLVDYCFGKLGKQRVVGVAHPDNIASRKVLQNAGLNFEKYDRYYQTECVYYSLDSEK